MVLRRDTGAGRLHEGIALACKANVMRQNGRRGTITERGKQARPRRGDSRTNLQSEFEIEIRSPNPWRRRYG
jgi:hypothetical protein